MTFSEQIVYALIKPEKYKDLLALKKGRFWLFAVVMAFVIGLVTYLVPSCALIAGFGGFENLFLRGLGPIEYTDGQLESENGFEMNINGTRILIDTEASVVADEKLDNDGVYMAFGSEFMRLCVVQGDQVVDASRIDYKYILPDGLNNKMLAEYSDTMYIYVALSFVMNSLFSLIKYCLLALLLAVMSKSVSMLLKLELPFKERFKLGFYAESLGMILTNFNMALNFLPGTIVSLVAVFITLNRQSKVLFLMKKE